jgi:hypothetical protein
MRDYGIWRQHFGEGAPPAPPRGTPGSSRPSGDQPLERTWSLLGAEGPSHAVPMIQADGLSLLMGGLLAFYGQALFGKQG